MSDLGKMMLEVAKIVWGDPNEKLSKGDDFRWGTAGARSVDNAKGTWFDHSSVQGGGVLHLLKADLSLDTPAAFEWLKERGFEVDDNRSEQPAQQREELPQNNDYDQSHPAEQIKQKQRVTYTVVDTYEYEDAEGNFYMAVEKLDPKSYRQKRKHDDGWLYGVTEGEYRRLNNGNWKRLKKDESGGVLIPALPIIPYNLPDVLDAISREQTIFIVEGEKDVETLRNLGCVATCNPMGAGKFDDNMLPYFVGADVVNLLDNDEPGFDHSKLVYEKLQPVALRIRSLELPGLPQKGDVTDWIVDQGHTVEQLWQAVETRAVLGPAFRSLFGAMSYRDLLRNVRPIEWLVRDFLPRGVTAMVFGPSGAGKSFICVDMIMHICLGSEWHGHKTYPHGVMFWALEGQTGISQRVKAWSMENGDPGDLPLSILTKKIDLVNDAKAVENIVSEIKAHNFIFDVPVGVIVLDTMARAMPGSDENSSKDVGTFLDRITDITTLTGVTVLLVHHTGKDVDRGARGWSGIKGAMDTEIELRKLDKNIKLTTLKHKDGPVGHHLDFKLHPIPIGQDDEGYPITSCVVLSIEPDNSPREAGYSLKGPAKIAWQALTQSLLDDGEKRVHSNIPNNATVVDYKKWRRRCMESGLVLTEDEEEFHKVFKRVGQTLREKNLIAVQSPWVWKVRV